MNPVITLTTDFGFNDAYVATMKGVILSINPRVTIVDITHSIEAQNITQAAFILNIAYRYFPEKSTHMAIVDPGVGSERRGVILKTPSSLFVAPDNGILSYVIDELSPNGKHLNQHSENHEKVIPKKGFEAVVITEPRFWRQPVCPTFHGRDIFAPVAAGLSLGISIYEFGERITSLHMLPTPKPSFDPQNNLIGHIIHIDNFGNLITDIRNTDLSQENIIVEAAGQYIQGISRYYEEGKRLLAILNSNGYLEISLTNGSAYDLLGLDVGDEVKVTFA
ncbi:MAG: SAM-dependent chlorinase/fluorinase [Dehalococcoidia bacterium]|nr:SAM-dependent chlorinase/fluorinase [Dehalococcoidia bacterium]